MSSTQLPLTLGLKVVLIDPSDRLILTRRFCVVAVDGLELAADEDRGSARGGGHGRDLPAGERRREIGVDHAGGRIERQQLAAIERGAVRGLD